MFSIVLSCLPRSHTWIPLKQRQEDTVRFFKVSLASSLQRPPSPALAYGIGMLWHAVACCGKSTAIKNQVCATADATDRRMPTCDTVTPRCALWGELFKEKAIAFSAFIGFTALTALCHWSPLCCWPASFLDAMGHVTWPLTRKWTEYRRIAQILSGSTREAMQQLCGEASPFFRQKWVDMYCRNVTSTARHGRVFSTIAVP